MFSWTCPQQDQPDLRALAVGGRRPQPGTADQPPSPGERLELENYGGVAHRGAHRSRILPLSMVGVLWLAARAAPGAYK